MGALLEAFGSPDNGAAGGVPRSTTSSVFDWLRGCAGAATGFSIFGPTVPWSEILPVACDSLGLFGNIGPAVAEELDCPPCPALPELFAKGCAAFAPTPVLTVALGTPNGRLGPQPHEGMPATERGEADSQPQLGPKAIDTLLEPHEQVEEDLREASHST